MGSRRATLAAPPPDPFGERHRPAWRERLQLLGGRFDFETDSARLLRIVRAAYAGLPAHRLSGDPRLQVRLMLGSAERAARAEPPPVRPLSGVGTLCGAVDGASFVTVTPRQHAALVVVGGGMLRHAYHVRYELLEFAVYVLATRVQSLVPLHAACLSCAGAGALLIGASGAGKSTVVLHGVVQGLELLAEDSVLIEPSSLKATGVASFVHLRRDSLGFLARAERAALTRNAVCIRRRSGVAKLEIDLRGREYRLAAEPPVIRALVFLSRRRGGRRLLTTLPAAEARRRLAASQRYASRQPGWRTFQARMAGLPAYELRRGEHPSVAVEALRELLGG
jgi:hypothetical protein